MTEAILNNLLPLRAHFLHFLERRVESPAIAEDILQNSYLRAIEHGSELRSDESAMAWFYRILRNAVVDHYRRRAAHDRALERWANDLATETTPDRETCQIVCDCIADALSGLKQGYAEAVRAVDLGGTSLEQFAQSSGITTGNAAVRVHRARQALKKQLIQICRTCSLHGCTDCTCR